MTASVYFTLVPLLAFAGDLETQVKSKEIRLRREGAARVTEWSGEVTYERGGRKARADWVRRDEVSGRVEAKGKVQGSQLLTDGGGLHAAGEEARQDGSGKGELLPAAGQRVRMRRTAADGKEVGKGQARKARWDAQAETVLLEGDAHFLDERGLAQADRIRYSHKDSLMRLAGGRPVLSSGEKDWSSAVQADRIDIHRGDEARRRVAAQGSVAGWVRFPGKEKALKR